MKHNYYNAERFPILCIAGLQGGAFDVRANKERTYCASIPREEGFIPSSTTAQCPHCGSAFIAATTWQRYCSEQCRQASRPSRAERRREYFRRYKAAQRAQRAKED